MSEYPLWRLILEILNFITTWGVAFYVYRNRQNEAASTRLTNMEQRLTEIENTIRHPPESQQLAGLDKRMAQLELTVKTGVVCSNHTRMEGNDVELFGLMRNMHGRMGELIGEIKGLATTVDAVNVFLMTKGRGA